MKQLTDEQRRMVEDNVKLVFSELRDAGYIGSRKDAEQELMLELCKAASRFDASKGTKFSTYAVSCLRSKIKELKSKGDLWSVRRQFGEEGKPYVGFEVTSLNRRVAGNDEYLELMDIITKDKEDQEDELMSMIDFRRFMEGLNPQERKMIEMRIQGYSYQEIGDAVGISEVHACRRVKKIYEKLNS